VKADKEKIAVINFIIDWVTVTGSIKYGNIKDTERFKQSKILHAIREAEAIKLVNANVVQNYSYTFYLFSFNK
jgi:hypothetical protein